MFLRIRLIIHEHSLSESKNINDCLDGGLHLEWFQKLEQRRVMKSLKFPNLYIGSCHFNLYSLYNGQLTWCLLWCLVSVECFRSLPIIVNIQHNPLQDSQLPLVTFIFPTRKKQSASSRNYLNYISLKDTYFISWIRQRTRFWFLMYICM